MIKAIIRFSHDVGYIFKHILRGHAKAVVCCGFMLPVFGVRVSVTFHLTCIYIISSPEPKAHW